MVWLQRCIFEMTNQNSLNTKLWSTWSKGHSHCLSFHPVMMTISHITPPSLFELRPGYCKLRRQDKGRILTDAMLSIFCCSNLQPFRPTRTDHEAKFTSFFGWAKFPTIAAAVHPAAGAEKSESLRDSNWPYAIQLAKQVNYGPLESKRYFVPLDDDAEFQRDH
jgi:hypothetical protein